MRIVHVDRQRHWAGQQVRTYAVMQGMIAEGHHVAVVCRPGSGYAERCERDGIPYLVLDMRGAKLPLSVLRLARYLRRERFDIVDAHGAVDHNLSLFAAALAPRVAVVRTKHNHTRLRGAISRYVSGRLTRRLVAISEHVRDLLVAQGIDPNHIDTVPSSIDTRALAERVGKFTRAEARAQLGVPADAFIVGTTARPSERKGLDIVCRAVALLRERAAEEPGRSPVVYLAAGPEPALMRSFAREHGLEGDALYPIETLADVAPVLAAIDVFVLASRQEALGVAMIEALAAGCAAVGSAVGGIPELVRDGETGLLVPPGEVEPLAAAIDRFRRDPALAAACGDRGRAWVQARHDVSQMVLGTTRSYERALGRTT